MSSVLRVGCAVALCAAALVGCAVQANEQDVSAVATRFLDATGRGDAESACALLAPRTREDLSISDGQPCAESLPTDRLRGTVQDVAVWSNWAQASTDGGTLFLTEFDSGWLIAAAGCQPNGEAPYHCVVGG